MAGKLISKFNTAANVAMHNIGKVGKDGAKNLKTLAKNPVKATGKQLLRNTGKTVKATANVASSFLKEDKKNSLLGYRVKKSGLALAVGAGALVSGAKETKQYFTEDLRGRKDTYTTPYAPSIQSSAGANFGQKAGATGDLVFALNNNRRG